MLKWRKAPGKGKKIAYVAGGTSIAVLGVLLVDGRKRKDPAGPHDVEALSRIPFGKLFTGWL